MLSGGKCLYQLHLIRKWDTSTKKYAYLSTFYFRDRDIVLLLSDNYEDVTEGDLKLKIEKLTIYVEHPVPIEPPVEPAPPQKLQTQR